MERSLLLAAFALASLCFIAGLIGGRPPKRSSNSGFSLPPSLWAFAASLPVLIWLLSFREKEPFSAGHGMGNGVLLGGLAGLLAAWLLGFSDDPADAQSGRGVRAFAGVFGLGALLAISPQIWQRGLLFDVLGGLSLGWAGVTVIVACGALGLQRSGAGIYAARLMTGLGFAVLALALVILGETGYAVSLAAKYHLVSLGVPGAWIVAGIPLILLVCSLPSGVYARWAGRLPFSASMGRLSERIVPAGTPQHAAGNVLRILLAALLLLVLGKLVGTKIVSHNAVFGAVRIGMVAGLLCAWIAASWRDGMAARFLAPLVLVAGGVMIFPDLTGAGMAIMLLSAWTIPALLLGSAEPDAATATEPLSGRALALTQAFAFGTLFVLYRVFTSRFEDGLRGLPLMDQNVVFAALCGAFVPSALAWLAVPNVNLKRLSVFCIGAAGVLALLVPAIAILFWGGKCTLALLVGLTLAAVVYASDDAGTASARALIAGLFAICITLVLCQAYPNLLVWTETTTANAVKWTKILVASGIVLYLIAGFVQKKNEEAAE
jgi:hypothetical protein